MTQEEIKLALDDIQSAANILYKWLQYDATSEATKCFYKGNLQGMKIALQHAKEKAERRAKTDNYANAVIYKINCLQKELEEEQ